MSCRPPTRPGPPRQAPPQVDGAFPGTKDQARSPVSVEDGRLRMSWAHTHALLRFEDPMPRDEDDLSFRRALADGVILSVAERDPARVAKAIADICERLAAERHIPMSELQAAVEALLLYSLWVTFPAACGVSPVDEPLRPQEPQRHGPAL